MITEFIEIRTATASQETAEEIAKTLVSKRLAPSAQVNGPISSYYWWNEVMVTATEWVVTAKTKSNLYEEIEQTIQQLHPYKIPGIVVFPITTGNANYFDWMRKETIRESKNEKRK